ncbi:MAG: carboxypeptidase regulatory-like domain-containing protein [Vicinamibacterales bacterium]
MRRISRAILVVAVLAASVAGAAAQGTTSRLVGTVTDSTGGVLPGATVTLTNDATGVSFTTFTTETGTYVFEAIQVGTYTVKVELQGFKTFTTSGNPIRIGTPTTVNVTLEPGAITETVEVTAISETVQTSTSGNLGTVLEQKVIESLPIVGTRGRNPLDLVLTQPGVVSGANTGGGTHVYGARDRSWNYTLDGIDTNETSAGGSNFSPLRTNPDSLAEFKVLTGNQTAEYGRNSGGQVAMVTRSGTNEIHGTGFYFRRQPEFNAPEWEGNLINARKEQFYQNIGGFSIGGPIQRNKMFYFGNLQVLRANRTVQTTSTTYTELARQGIWRYVIGGRNQPAGLAASSVDNSGNVLPGIQIGTYNIAANDPQGIGLNPDVLRLVGLTPLPNNFTTGDGLNLAGYTFFPEEWERQYDSVIKIDRVLNDKHYAYARIAWGEQNTICDRANSGWNPFPGVACLVDTFRRPINLAASWRWNPRSNLVNEFVFGINKFEFDFNTPEADPRKVDFTGQPITAPVGYSVGNQRGIKTFQFVDNVSWVTGAHSVKFGTNMRFQRHEDVRGSVGGYNVTPWVNFSTSINTVDPATFGIPSNINTTFDRPALQSSINYLLGRVGQVSQGFVSTGSQYAPGGTPFIFDARFPEIDFFVQDTWKPVRNVTVDAGLRWELKLAPSNPHDLIRRPGVRVAVGEQPTSTLKWDRGKLYDNDLNNVAPSVGVAWDPQGNGKQVIRGNYRMAFDRINTFVLSSAIFQSIPGITAGVTNTAFGQAGGRLPQVGPVVASLQPTFTPDSFVQPPVPSTSSMRVVDNAFETPTTHAWAVSYQREIMPRTVLEVAYIGRRASHLFGAYDINQVDITDNGFLDAFKVVQAGGQSALMNQLLQFDTRRQASETGSDMVRRLYASSLQTNSVAALADDLGSRIQGGKTLPELAGLSPYFFFNYPQFLGGLIVIDSNDRSRYHALQMQVERRHALGYLQVAYTLSKSEDTRSFDPAFTTAATGNAQSASSTPFDIYDRDLNFAPSDFDRRHVVQSSFSVELPLGQGRAIAGSASPALDRLISGWNLAGTVTWQSGRPFTVYSGGNTISNIVQTPANCSGCSRDMGQVFRAEGNGYIWFFDEADRAKFSAPAPGEFSNVGRNYFIGPSGLNVNFSLAKRTRVVGAQSLEIRMDATNFLNQPTFGFPTATITSTTFGRIYNSVVSGSRRIQLGVKYYF